MIYIYYVYICSGLCETFRCALELLCIYLLPLSVPLCATFTVYISASLVHVSFSVVIYIYCAYICYAGLGEISHSDLHLLCIYLLLSYM